MLLILDVRDSLLFIFYTSMSPFSSSDFFIFYFAIQYLFYYTNGYWRMRVWDEDDLAFAFSARELKTNAYKFYPNIVVTE